MLTSQEVTRLLDVANAGVNKGQIKLARDVYDGILAGNPEHAPTLISYALSHIAVGEFQQADEILNDKVLSKNPEDADALAYLALSAHLAGRKDEVAAILDRIPAAFQSMGLVQSLRIMS